ncbi:MAG: nucleotidyltransferase domain-containing protein [Candidatus Nanohaloarchaea archaeon]|nr:nucleotidyltransferase domain-containing protein [Candidatus Nanohaloarchaea archaeon]
MALDERDRHEEAFDRFREQVMDRFGDRVEKLILFGSVARGDHGEDSDVDVLIVVDDKSVKQDIVGIAFDIMLATDIYISPKVISTDQLARMERMNGSLLDSIQEEMKVYG